MSSSPITSWQLEGENVDGLTDFISWVPKITEDNDSSHEIKRCLLLGRKAIVKYKKYIYLKKQTEEQLHCYIRY